MNRGRCGDGTANISGRGEVWERSTIFLCSKSTTFPARGAINIGNNLNIGNASYSKALGGSSPIGDFSNNADFERNVYIDPDLFDNTNAG
ncbi:spore germination protein [Staphylospora marina]|uniref:spore germination protein n=1 Tax=Staphylospora marina TaxID=2490858 RepID=UPI000F5BAB8B|nr:spore germination protein [Staphylospora marina]